MCSSFFKPALTKAMYLRSLKPGTRRLDGSSSPSMLKRFSASLRLCGWHSGFSFAALLSLLVAQPAGVSAQNVPPMLGDHIGKPKISVPNPLGTTQKGNSQSSQSSQSASAAGEREVQGFLENWRSSFSKKDIEVLSTCYLQTDALRVYWESQEFSGWEPFKAEMQRRFGSPEAFQLELKDPQVSVFGRFAWVTAHYFRPIWSGASAKSQEGVMTLVLEKRRAAWVILHQHASVVQPEPPLVLSTK